MDVSPDAGALMRDIRELRAARELSYLRDMDSIDAEYDRRLRRIHARRSSCRRAIRLMRLLSERRGV
jgi:hypothetical protein